jgi:hypothetical protein
MFRHLLFLGWLLVASVVPALALPPDDYLGDSAIYAGVPSERPKPNVLLLIDTSRATLSIAAGLPYSSATTYTSPLNFVSNYIYTPGQDGQFDAGSQVVKSGSTALVLGDGVNTPGVTCVAT